MDRAGDSLHRGSRPRAPGSGPWRGSRPSGGRARGLTMSRRDEEWLETDGLGGVASRAGSGMRTRRYHGVLVTAMTPPTGRQMLVSGFDVWVETPGGRWSLSTQRYAGDVVDGDGEQHIESFTTGADDGGANPWPTWTYRLP